MKICFQKLKDLSPCLLSSLPAYCNNFQGFCWRWKHIRFFFHSNITKTKELLPGIFCFQVLKHFCLSYPKTLNFAFFLLTYEGSCHPHSPATGYKIFFPSKIIIESKNGKLAMLRQPFFYLTQFIFFQKILNAGNSVIIIKFTEFLLILLTLLLYKLYR